MQIAQSRPLNINSINPRNVALLCASLLYATLGSPTPDNPGWIEAIIAIFLLLSLPPKNILNLINFHKTDTPFLQIGRLFLFTGLLIGLIGALFQNTNLPTLLRDLIPFTFLFFPLLYKGRKQTILLSVLIIGLGFALRSLWNLSINDLLGSIQNGIIAKSSSGELLYLANMPTVLFAAIYISANAAKNLFQPLTPKKLIKTALLLLIALLPLLALITSLQRASLAGYIISLSLLLILAFINKPAQSLKIILALALTILVTMPALSMLWDIFYQKTTQVGGNMRIEEISAIWDSISASPYTLLFGLGWGSSFESPAVGGIDITFTHSLLSTMLLKTGLIGITLTITYLLSLTYKARHLFQKNPILALSLLSPILIDVFLYASFKSFDFGLILCLVLAQEKNHPDQEETI